MLLPRRAAQPQIRSNRGTAKRFGYEVLKLQPNQQQVLRREAVPAAIARVALDLAPQVGRHTSWGHGSSLSHVLKRPPGLGTSKRQLLHCRQEAV